MTRSRKMPQKLPKPALGRGRIQRAIRRAFLLSDVVSTSEIADAAYARRPDRRRGCDRVRRRLRDMP